MGNLVKAAKRNGSKLDWKTSPLENIPEIAYDRELQGQDANMSHSAV